MEKFVYKFENHSTIANVCTGILLTLAGLWGIPTGLLFLLGLSVAVLGITLIAKIDDKVRKK